MPAAALQEHLGACPACRTWAERARAATRAMRLHPADPVPDLTESILAAIAAAPAIAGPRRARLRSRLADWGGDTRSLGCPAPGGGARSPAEAPSLVRLALFLVAGAQVIIALPALFGDDLGATIHVAHEQGAWGLALAAGMAFGAWRPTRATAMVPVLGVFVACLGLMTALDISAGRVAPSAEAPHLMAAFGLVLLWLESHPPLALRTGPASAPHPAAGRRVAA